MNKILKLTVSTALIIVFAFECFFASEKSNAETAEGQIYSLVPKVEEYYNGIEDYIAKCLRERKTTIDITAYRVTVGNILHVYKSAVFTNPDIFYVDASLVKYQFDNDSIVHYIDPVYILKRSQIPTYTKRFNRAVKYFLSNIDSALSDFQKALLIHDKIIVNCQYKQDGDLAYTAYGAIVNKKAVCEGYTRAYCWLLSKAGVDSKCINIEKKTHCWNYVKIGNDWYHVDVTSDDPLPDSGGHVSHKFFLLSDSKLKSYKTNVHTGYKSDVTYKNDYNCLNTKFNSSFFRKINSQILLIKNIYYFINSNYKNKHYSAFISRKNSKNKVIMLVKDKWRDDNGVVYKRSFSKLCCLDSQIYINSSRAIYRYKPNNRKLRRIFVMPDFWKKDFYGIKACGRYILTDKKKSVISSSAKSKILYIRENKTVLRLPFIRKSSVKIQQKKNYIFKVYKGSGRVRYKSSDRKIARVNSKGVVRALKKGLCTITAVKNSKTFKLKVKVI